MNVFLAATDVTLTVPLTDSDGNVLNVSAVQYRVTDSGGNEVLALTNLVGYSASSPTAVILLPAAKNIPIAGTVRDLRHIELRCTIGSNIVIKTVDYIIESGDQLEIGVNSFQSLAQAHFNAALIPNLEGWSASSAQQQTAALIDARLHICQLNFSSLTGNNLWGQDSLNFIPEGSTPTNHVGRAGGFVWGGNLSFVRSEQFLKLPDVFRKALNRAQIAEADAILGGSPQEDKRRSGLLLDTVGESKQMYRAGKPLELPVSRRALSYLSMFVTFNKLIARG